MRYKCWRSAEEVELYTATKAFFAGRPKMGSKSKVISHTVKALNARTVEEKLDEIARAIAELAKFVDDIEDQVRRVR